MRQTIGLMAACAALLASCTNEVGEGLGVDTPIRVTASVEGALTTRTDNSTESLSTFGLSIKDGTGYTGNYAGENILAEKDNGTWTLSKTVLYQGSGQSYYAYAPYKEGHTGESLTFTVDADQAANDLQGSDLLHASGSVTSANLDITLAHKLSKLTVTVTKKGEENPIEVGDVTLRGTVPTATLDLTNGDVAASGTETSEIKMWHNTTGGTYECILVPQTVKYSVVIDAKVNNSPKSYVYTPANAYEFKSNNSYTLTLTVRKADEPTAIEGINVAGWGDGNDIALGDGEIGDGYTYDANTNTYTVSSAKGLQEWAEAAREGNSRNPVNCTLAADINMTGQSWTPIGMEDDYTGVFDGNGHTITGLGDCLLDTNDGTVRNLTFIEPTISSSSVIGAVARNNYDTIENCHVEGGSLKGSLNNVGGIAGLNWDGGTIRACSSSATVNADRVGGIVGYNEGSVLACYATGSVTGIENGEYNSIGAIVGWHDNDYGGTITACYWSGDTEKGVGNGNGSADGTTKVEGNEWTAAMSAMNTALNGTGYLWTTNGDDETGNRPLIIATE